MYCTFRIRPKGKSTAIPTTLQFQFAGGYIGAILPAAKMIARERKAVLVPLEGQDWNGGPLLVDCRLPKDDAAEFVGVL